MSKRKSSESRLSSASSFDDSAKGTLAQNLGYAASCSQSESALHVVAPRLPKSSQSEPKLSVLLALVEVCEEDAADCKVDEVQRLEILKNLDDSCTRLIESLASTDATEDWKKDWLDCKQKYRTRMDNAIERATKNIERASSEESSFDVEARQYNWEGKYRRRTDSANQRDAKTVMEGSSSEDRSFDVEATYDTPSTSEVDKSFARFIPDIKRFEEMPRATRRDENTRQNIRSLNEQYLLMLLNVGDHRYVKATRDILSRITQLLRRSDN